MRSIYEHAMGSDFSRLHPQIQRRFGFSSRDNVASLGTGVVVMCHFKFKITRI